MGTRGFSKGFSSGFLHAVQSTLNASEAADTASFVTVLRDQATLIATEFEDTASFSVETAGAIGRLNATEPEDTSVISGVLRDRAILVALETRDVAVLAVDSGAAVQVVAGGGAIPRRLLPRKIRFDRARVYAIETLDVAVIRGATKSIGRLAALELSDDALVPIALHDQMQLSATEEPDRINTGGESDDDPTLHNENFLMLAA